MPKHLFTCILAVATLSCPIWSEPSYEVTWEASGEGGFSASNVIRETGTGKTLGIVACKGRLGVVCFDLNGNRQWEHPMVPPVSSAPAVADVDGDGQEDVVAADSKGNLVALTASGKVIWSTCVPGGVIADSQPSVVDLDGDGSREILVGDVGGTVSCLDNKGNLKWQFSGDGTQMGPLLVADLYDSPGLEVVAPSHDSHVYILSSSGEWIWDFYREDDLFPSSLPVLADVDGDNRPELYIGGGLFHFYRIDLESRKAVLEANVAMHVSHALAASDLDGDGKDEVVFATKGGSVRCYGEDGFRWLRELPAFTLHAGPTLVNLDEDPDLEIIVYSRRGDIQFLDTDGASISTAKSSCDFWVVPLAGDFDGDGMLEVIGTQSGEQKGDGKIQWAEIGVPYREDPRNRTAFAGNRARTGLSSETKVLSTLPFPQRDPGLSIPEAERVGSATILSGPNLWRFDIANPEQRRLVFISEMVSPDGVARRFARHVYGPKGRAVIPFEAVEPGDYAYSMQLVDCESLQRTVPRSESFRFEGFNSDKEYLEGQVCAEIENALESWQETNPGYASGVRAALLSLRGMLAGLAGMEKEPDRVKYLALLRESSERLRTLVVTGSNLSPQGSFLAWEFNPWAHFDSRDTLPSSENRTEQLRTSLCVGEYDSLALNLTNLSARTLEVRVLCDGIEGAGGIAWEDHLQFRRAVTVPTVRRERVADALPALDQGGLITLPPHESQQLWITVNAKGLDPGEYVAKLRLKSVEPDPTEKAIPIKMTVHDLHLPRPRPLRLCLWSYDGKWAGTDRVNALRNLVDHGTTVFFGKSPLAECDAEGSLVGPLDYTAHDENLKRLSPHGIVLFVGPQSSLKGQEFLSEPWRKAFVKYLREWVAYMKETGMGYEDWALYPYDEPSTPYAETTVNLVAVAKLIRQADPNILIYTDPTCGMTMETVEMFTGLIDIWCPSAELLRRFGKELLPVAKQVGKEIWNYDPAGRARTLSCLGIYRWRFWNAWNDGFTGVGWWCYSHHRADYWDGPNPTGNYYPTIYDGPRGEIIDSKRWEAGREGVEDYEYLYMLREAIREAEERGVVGEPLENAKRVLEEVPREVETVLWRVGRRLELTPDSVPLYDEATRILAEARQQIVEACLGLRE